MDQLFEIVLIISQVMEKHGQSVSLNTLVDEVNLVLKDRPLSGSTVKLVLTKNINVFTETEPDKWGLKKWDKENRGVSKIYYSGSENPWKQVSGRIESFEPMKISIKDAASALIDHLVPMTKDRPTIDKLSEFHVVESSYKENSLPRDTLDSNFLVPPMLYEMTKDLSWRFPPMMETSFFIKAEPGKLPKLHIRAIIGVGSLLEYQEWRPFGEKQRYMRRYVSKPEINTPKGFSELKLNNGYYFLKENIESTDFCQKSYRPLFYELNINQELQQNSINVFEIPVINQKDVVVKAYNEINSKILEQNQVDDYNPSNLFPQIEDDEDPRWALVVLKRGEVHAQLSIEIKNRPDWEVIEVVVRLSNTYLFNNKRLDDENILLHSIIFPHLYISLAGASFILGSQQHKEFLDDLHFSHKLSTQAQFIADLTTQTNCVLTHSLKEENLLVTSQFGVYDTIRVDPIPGPTFESLYENIDSFINASTLSDNAIQYIKSSPYRSACLLIIMKAIQRSFRGTSGPLKSIYLYQWKAIQNRIEILSSKSKNMTTVIRAPTGAGKTLVFFANAAIHYLFTGQRAVMTFPTRILNEDMFKRLTRFIFALRDEIKNIYPELEERIMGGILIGTSDPSYNAIVNPEIGKMMAQYDACPKCQEQGKRKKIICNQVNGRLLGICEDCGHVINYMLGPKEVGDFLPAITIATPDKLFYEATVRAPQKSLRFFGAPCIRCNCGYHITLMNKDGQIGDTVKCPQCGNIIDKEEAFKAGSKVLPKLIKSPPLYFVLDEIHSLYGITATLISYFFSLLRVIAQTFDAEYEQTFETGTATIANEKELIEAVTHQNMALFPTDQEFFTYFEIKADRVRYRTLIFMPVGKANRSTITNAILAGYRASLPGGYLSNSIQKLAPEDYDFLLAYIPRKSNGYIIANELRRVLDDKSITFLSGDAPTARLVTLLQEIFDQKTNLLLANMVVSLGIDIPRLNNMLMLGVPKSMTEMVQTVGRTGRGKNAGHVVIHLQPSIPRDEFVYRNFHRVMGDVEGYFDRKPVAPVNTYVADLIFINVIYALLSTRLSDDYLNSFCNRAGEWLADNNVARNILGRIVKEVLGRDGPVELQREVVKIIQPRLREVILELSTKRQHLFEWVEGRPDVLYSLRARADRVPVAIAQMALLDEMKKGISRDLRPVDEESSQQ